MGVDYTAVAGFTVKVPKEVLAASEYEFTSDLFDDLGLDWSTVGCSYSGATEDILLFKPDSCVDLDAQISIWLKEVNAALGTKFSAEDVRFVSDLHVW